MSYFKKHSDEVMASMDPDDAVFRYRTVEALLAAGIPLEKLDILRPLLQRSGYSLTDTSNMKMFIPKIEEKESKRLSAELAGNFISIAFDGTTRLGEAICVTGRWCSASFELTTRLIDFTTLLKHVDHKQLATHVTDLVMRKRRIAPTDLVGLSRDSVSTNGAASARLQLAFPVAADMLCFCHTLCHVGEHFELPVLSEFRTPWLELVGGRNPHMGAKMLWKDIVSPAKVPGFSNVRWYSWAEIVFVIAEAGMHSLDRFLTEVTDREYGDATRSKLIELCRGPKREALEIELAALLDMRELVKTTYELEGDRLEVLLLYDRIEKLRAIGKAIKQYDDGVLPNVDAVLRKRLELKKDVKIMKHFNGHGICEGKLLKMEKIDSTLYPGQERNAWLVKYEDGVTEHFEEEELRFGRPGPPVPGSDGKPYLVVKDMGERKQVCDSLWGGFQYLENRVNGDCQANYSCVNMYKLCCAARMFDPYYAKVHATPEMVDRMNAITPLSEHGIIPSLKQELPLYLAAAATSPSLSTDDVDTYTEGILEWWRVNGGGFKSWKKAAQITFALSPNSASCERVFSLLSHMFGDDQRSALADYLRAALMLKYNKRVVG